MYFYYELDIPPNTLEKTPVIVTAKLVKGFLDFVDVGIPRRVQRLAKCRIFYNQLQLVPFNLDKWLSGEDVTLKVPIQVEMNKEPFELAIYAYNDDDTYLHQFSFGISVDIGRNATPADLAALSQLVQVPEVIS